MDGWMDGWMDVFFVHKPNQTMTFSQHKNKTEMLNCNIKFQLIRRV